MTTTPRTNVPRSAIALLLWTWYTALALVAAWPFFLWIAGDTGVAPETDVLLDGLQLGALIELLQGSGGSLGQISATLLAVLGLGLLSNAFLGGGLFALLAGPSDEGPLLARFFEAAGRFFLRSLGLVVVSAAAILVGGGVLAVAASGALGSVLASAGERGDVAQKAISLLVFGGIAAFCLLALDYARVWMVRTGARGVVRTWLRGASFVLRHPLTAVTPALLYGVAIVVALALGGWAASAAGGRTWGAIAGVLVVQQTLLFVRIRLRVAMVGAEGRAADRSHGGRWAASVSTDSPPGNPQPALAP